MSSPSAKKERLGRTFSKHPNEVMAGFWEVLTNLIVFSSPLGRAQNYSYRENWGLSPASCSKEGAS